MFRFYSFLLVITIICLTGFEGTESATTNKTLETSANDSECLKRAGELDRCLPKLIFYGDRKFDPPRSDEELDQHCRIVDENLKCVTSYSRECLPSFAKSLYSVMTRRLKGQFAKRCKSSEGRKDFLNLMVCADPKHMEPAHKCMDSFVAHLEQIGTGEQSRLIELSCCTFQLFQECIFKASRNMQCKERIFSAERSINYVKSIITSMGGDMMELMCGRFDNVQSCNSGHASKMKEFRRTTQRIENGTMKPHNSSPVKPMLQLFIDTQLDS